MTLGDVASVAGLLVSLCCFLLWASWLIARRPRTKLPLLAVPCLFGAAFAYSALTAPHGYAAADDFGGAWFAAAGLAVAGALLAIVRPVRRAGIAGLVAGLVLLLTFYGVYFTGYGLGLHSWKTKVRSPIPATEPR